eukprot:g13062.t1 g13062   contig7:800285-800898(+)
MTKATKTQQQRQLHSKPVCGRPLNSYNIFFILERERLIQSKSKEGTATLYHRDHDAEVTSASVGQTQEEKLERSTSDMYREFIDLELPPFPSRYRSIEGNLQVDWYMYDKNKNKPKRRHTKTHGAASFTEIVHHVSSTWKKIDTDVLRYVKKLESILRK